MKDPRQGKTSCVSLKIKDIPYFLLSYPRKWRDLSNMGFGIAIFLSHFGQVLK